MIEACVFDLDGVIVDTAKYHFLAWKDLASRFGIDFSPSDNENLKGVSRVNSLKYILDLGNITMTDQELIKLAHDKNEEYLKYVQTLNHRDTLPGVNELIVELKSNNIKCAIGSASKNARLVLEKLDIIDKFDVIIDGNDTTKSKPHPEVFLKATTSMGCKDAIVFEDAPKGVDAALAAGYFAIGVGSPESLGHAHHVIPGFTNFHFSNLKDIYQQRA